METKMRIAACLALALLFVCGSVQADMILLEDFEDSTVGYTVNIADDLTDISNLDYFGRVDPDNTVTPPAGGNISYSGENPGAVGTGNGFYTVHDADGANSGDVDVFELTFSGINTSGFENLVLSWQIAEDDSDDGFEDWDSASSFRVEVDNGSGFTQIFRVESELGGDGNEVNEVARVDTDNDGVGDGIIITDTYHTFTTGLAGIPALANAGSYDIKFILEFLDAGDEDIALDNVLLTGDSTVIPEPSTFAMFALAIGVLNTRRRRRN